MEPAQPPATEPPAPPAKAQPGGRRIWTRRILLIVLITVGVSLLGALGFGFLLYDSATRPDRSAPDVAVDNYLGALLVDRDDTRANLFACANTAALSAIHAFRDEIKLRESQLGASIAVNVAINGVSNQSDRKAEVTATIRRSTSAGGVAQSVIDNWLLVVTDNDGWRVCGATRIP